MAFAAWFVRGIERFKTMVVFFSGFVLGMIAAQRRDVCVIFCKECGLVTISSKLGQKQ